MIGNRLVACVVLAWLFGAAVAVAYVRDQAYGETRAVEQVLYVRSGEALTRASLSNAALLADVYWIRAIQHYGGTRISKEPGKRYDLLYPLLDLVTTLDPRFTIAYRFGAIFLSEPYPGGPGRPDLSIALLEKGVRAEPAKWRYEEDLGFVYYWWLHDYGKAAQHFERGSRIAGAPWWMRSLAAATLGTGGDRRRSRFLWQELYQAADNEWLKNNARLRLTQLDALDEIEQLQRIAQAFAARNGAPPSSWAMLVRTGWLRAEPLDPAGAPYVLNPETGRVNVSASSKLHPLPIEPGAWMPQPQKQ
jgi:hypothetical protein